MNNSIVAICVFLFLCCGGCGGGASTAPSPSSQPTSAVIKISTQGSLSSGTSISGVGITLNLPQGATVKTNQDGSVASGVVVPSGVTTANDSSILAEYVPASGSGAAKLKIVV